MAAADASAHLDALYPAVAAVMVAVIGVSGNVILKRRRSTEEEDDEDLNVIRALAAALAAETEARKEAERRADLCEAREQVRKGGTA